MAEDHAPEAETTSLNLEAVRASLGDAARVLTQLARRSPDDDEEDSSGP